LDLKVTLPFTPLNVPEFVIPLKVPAEVLSIVKILGVASDPVKVPPKSMFKPALVRSEFNVTLCQFLMRATELAGGIVPPNQVPPVFQFPVLLEATSFIRV
jgi:hypothetical protein